MGKLVDKVLRLMGFEVEKIEELEEEEGLEHWQEPVVTYAKRGNVVNLHTQKHVRMVIAKPTSFEQVQGMADHLKSHRPVIVNLEEVDKELARRIIDFLSGTTYALSGSMQKVGNSIFLFVPSNVDLAGAITTNWKEKGVFSWLDNS
ncbi:cell division protein SepF [Calderihabitans maritimus]|uniref:Cell division protein SepF n=1 Tax=Calderihabitans maritimus TaxID=1246530 RepID=A0A1Z5HTB2_9FIRM|nr:cell division protein SepF [Calderihabitans maritimus]GAW92587.1 Cell division protein sepF [Calderihabitans maritimus]